MISRTTCAKLCALSVILLTTTHGSSADIEKEIETLRSELRSQLEIIKEKGFALQGQLFSSPEQIETLCSLPAQIPIDQKLDEYLISINGDTSAPPNVDCIYMKTNDGSDTLFSYNVSPRRSWYLTVKRNWIFPSGLVYISKHPFHEIQLWTRNTTLNRVTYSPDDAFPIRHDKKLSLVQTSPEYDARESNLYVRKTFEFDRDGEHIDNLHVLVRDYGTIPFFGEPTKIRQWYLYSERANVILRDSMYRGPHGMGGIDSTGIEAITFYRNGAQLYILSSDELGPLRSFLSTFNPWN